MNYIHHLNCFFRLAQQDARLRPCHISLYMALFQRWNHVRFEKTFTVKREWAMSVSKIGSKATYHKCLKELHQAHYIVYYPAISKYSPIKVTITQLKVYGDDLQQPTLFEDKSDTRAGPLLSSTSTENEPVQVPKVGRIYKHINNIKTAENRHSLFFSEKKSSRPSLAEIESYFLAKAKNAAEARKFFLHFESTGWLTGHCTAIVNWQAAADKWIMNIFNTKTHLTHGNDSNHLHSQIDKNYSEPF